MTGFLEERDREAREDDLNGIAASLEFPAFCVFGRNRRRKWSGTRESIMCRWFEDVNGCRVRSCEYTASLSHGASNGAGGRHRRRGLSDPGKAGEGVPVPLLHGPAEKRGWIKPCGGARPRKFFG